MYKFAITRPITTLMFAFAILFFGFLGVKKMPTSLFPDIDFPVAVVITSYPGASAEIVETKVTDKIEEAVMGIDGIKKVTSSSARNVSMVIVQFELEKPLDSAVNDVRDKVGSLQLDSGVKTPSINKFDSSSMPIVSIFLTSDKVSSAELMRHAKDNVKPLLQKISGVGGVEMRGHRERQIRIFVSPSMLNKYGLTYTDISNKIGLENLEIDGGRLIGTLQEWVITTDAQSTDLSDVGNIRVAEGIRLGDIATIEDGIEEDKTFASLNKTPGVIFEVQKISGANDIAIADAVMKVLPQIEAISPDYEVRAFKDTTQNVRSAIASVEFDVLLGVFLAVFVVFIFLRSGTITLVSAISIPISIFGTFALMNFFGFSLNMLTLLAVALAIGIIIDDAIVVIENIHKKLESGMRKREAAYEGVREIGFALIAISAMLLSVFIPVGSMSGIVGRFFQSFGITVAAAIGISYIVVITIIPMVSSIVVNPKYSRFYYRTEPFFKALDGYYVKTLAFVLRNKIKVIVGVIGVFFLSIMLLAKIGMEFIIPDDKSEFQVFLETKPGISMSAMKEKTGILQDIVMANENVEFTSLQIGYTNEKNIFKAQIYARLKPIKDRKLSQFEIMAEVGEKLKSSELANEFVISLSEVSDMGGGDNSPYQVAILAPSDEALHKSKDNLIALLKNDPTLAGKVDNIHINAADNLPEYRLRVLKQNASRYGVSAKEIGNVVRGAFSGEAAIGYYKERGKEYDITIRVPDTDRISINDIKKLQVKNGNGELMFVEGLVEIESTTAPSVITRLDRQRSLTVYAYPVKYSGISLGDMMKITAQKQGEWLESGATFRLQGEAENAQEMMIAFLVAVLTAIVLIYLILAALYESFLQPIVIMMTLPFSFSGAFIALFVVGQPFSMFSLMGLMILMGLVGKNATLLIDVANEKRKEGYSTDEALILAGESRLRPILMTTIAMVFGMIPLAISVGSGAGMKSPMGICIIGGLLFSMFLSLLIVPALYRLLVPIDDWLQRFYKPKAEDKF
ncbi:cytoplasmic pump protein of the hefABC efflux system HefC [Helicobacter cinaedi PAGU611]|uniref:Acriflavine resistance protein n=1 Tax=Helicobacter cinaedi CCUG 18818 = ATCC BAA-847 TaxID=537971 RepID=A0AAI8QGE3_9HELI|nr:efflux RND transporter permease subunit [Helicobacter cinaedi]AWK61424.1 acriflavin resistance protein [Helicobacter cinaedi]EFR46425.1 RND transporter, HAE1 family [Helicobacter cinaedi CCUG 18818 = ATCC BAA-847]QOQ89992.1 efflux RND transporter permease subunit [Helicobacter cinaedi]QOQ96173.1 efflux RND transporter permease subunit [Helicobacter cinaedi]BAM14983.1 cytoplasmic pump protein of the hefABC efflux system HefC [Helicobacter cinaedi PAGU611]